MGEFVKCRICGTACRREAAGSHLAVAHSHYIKGVVDRVFEQEAEEAGAEELSGG